MSKYYLGPHGFMDYEVRFAWFPKSLTTGEDVWLSSYYSVYDYTTWFDGGEWKDEYYSSTKEKDCKKYIKSETKRNNLYSRRYIRAMKGLNWGYEEEKRKGLVK